MLTIYDKNLAISSSNKEGFDYETYERTISSYMKLANKTCCSPVIEHILDSVMRYLEISTFNDIRGMINNSMKANGTYTTDDALEMAHNAASRAVESLQDGLFKDVELILLSQNLTWRSEDPSRGMFNSPQINVLDYDDDDGEDDFYEDD